MDSLFMLEHRKSDIPEQSDSYFCTFAMQDVWIHVCDDIPYISNYILINLFRFRLGIE